MGYHTPVNEYERATCGQAGTVGHEYCGAFALTMDDIKRAWVEQFELPEDQEQAALIFQDILNAHDRKTNVQTLRDLARVTTPMLHLNGYPVEAIPKAELLATAALLEKG